MFIFYILQKRELESYRRERTASIKQEQVTEIFNNQSDAIVVFETPKTQEQANEQFESNEQAFNILFSNKESAKLLQFEF